MAAGDQKRDKGKWGRRRGEQRREQMAFEVVDADGRDAQRKRKRMRERRAHQQRAGEARALGIADARQVRRAPPRAGEHLTSERHKPPDVVARSQLWDHAAVSLVHRDLRMHGVGEQAGLSAVVQGDAGFIARSLDPKDEHGTDFDTIQPPKEPRAGCQQ